MLVPGLVAGVTLGARRWGPQVGGWLTALPLVAGPTLLFLSMEQGAPLAIRLLRGFFPAMWGFALFCLVVAQAIVPLGPGLAFVLAIAAQLAVHGLVLWRMVRAG